MKKNNRNILIAIIIIFFLSLNICSCSKAKKEKKKEEKSKINIYTDIKDEYSLNIIQLGIDSYKEKNNKVEIIIKNSINQKDISKYLNDNKDIDLVITNRNNMLEISNKGLLANLNGFYNKNDINNRFYNIITAYGMKGDKYFGLALVPFTIEIIYNEKYFNSMGITNTNNKVSLEELIKNIKDKNLKIPMVIPESMDTMEMLSIIFGNSLVDNRKLESIYDSGGEKYKEFKDVQNFLDSFNKLIKSGYFNKETFERGNESTIAYVERGEYPMAFVVSYYNQEMAKANIKVLDNYKILGKENTPVVLVDTLISLTNNSKNTEDATDFIKFICSDEFQDKLADSGVIVGNKKSLDSMISLYPHIKGNLSSSNMDSVVYIYNLPIQMRKELKIEIESLSKGKYDGKEWSRIIDSLYK